MVEYVDRLAGALKSGLHEFKQAQFNKQTIIGIVILMVLCVRAFTPIYFSFLQIIHQVVSNVIGTTTADVLLVPLRHWASLGMLWNVMPFAPGPLMICQEYQSKRQEDRMVYCFFLLCKLLTKPTPWWWFDVMNYTFQAALIVELEEEKHQRRGAGPLHGQLANVIVKLNTLEFGWNVYTVFYPVSAYLAFFLSIMSIAGIHIGVPRLFNNPAVWQRTFIVFNVFTLCTLYIMPAELSLLKCL